MGEAKRKAAAMQQAPAVEEDWLNAMPAGTAAVQPMTGTVGQVDETAVTPEEQEQYEDFVSRAIHFINDTRSPAGGTNVKAPADAIIERLNQGHLPVPEALGSTVAEVAFLIHNNAKRQGVEYSADVMWHGADEILSQLLDIGRASGVFPKLPPENSEAEEKLLGMAKAEAARYFGQKLIDTGQAPKEEAQAFMQEQMQREADTGELDSWNPMDDISPEALTGAINRVQSGQTGRPDMREQMQSAGMESLSGE